MFFRQNNSLVIYLVNALLSRNFGQKSMRVNFCNFHTVFSTRKFCLSFFAKISWKWLFCERSYKRINFTKYFYREEKISPFSTLYYWASPEKLFVKSTWNKCIENGDFTVFTWNYYKSRVVKFRNFTLWICGFLVHYVISKYFWNNRWR